MLDNNSISPVLDQDFYEDSYEEILFFKTVHGYENIIFYKNQTVNLIFPRSFEYKANGIWINPYNTKIIPVDIDIPFLVNEFYLNFSKLNIVNQIDILSSSYNKKVVTKYHIIIGLNNFYNILDILPFFPNICKSYVDIILKSKKIILRTGTKNQNIGATTIKSDLSKIKLLYSFIKGETYLNLEQKTYNRSINLRV